MGCQTAIAASIVAAEADYVLALKANQGRLYAETVALFAANPAHELPAGTYQQSETVNKGHGRIETRRCSLITDERWLNYLNEEDRWTGLRGLAMVEAERRIGEVVEQEVRYYISSLTNAAEVGRAVRAHWGIENGLHWVLDMSFREDYNRNRTDHSAENGAVLRHIALNLLKQERSTKLSLKGKRLKAGWDEAYLQKVLLAL